MVRRAKKPFRQPAEKEFTDVVVKAILKNDTSRKHYLIDDKGRMRYESFLLEAIKGSFDVRYENGDSVKMVCVFGKELISDFHFKAGNDELALPWARKAVGKVIEHGKKVAAIAYNQD